jgi:hypothetical protein
MNMSQHATVRSQQRCIPHLVLDLLLQFGASEPSGDGTHKMFFDKSARRHVHAYVGPMARLVDEHLDVYAVVSDVEGKIITAAHRLERIRRN